MRFSDFVAVGTSQNYLCAVFGDFKEYIIGTRQDLRIQRLVERYAPNVGFLPTARLGGGVAVPEAFRILKVSA
jgi:HK97 family phage major capsid protein